MKSDVETVIIGSGIIGLATAFHLANAGREVLLFDPRGAGGGASYGNACTLAPYAVTPVGHPDIISSLPGLLFSADSPLSLRSSALPQLFPWLMRFARECTPARTRSNSAHIAAILKHAVPEWQHLAAEAGVSKLFRTNGCLYAYHNPDPKLLTSWPARLRAAHDVKMEVLSPTELAKLEPQLPVMKGGGLYFPDAVQIDDPATLTAMLAAAVVKRGGSLHQASVTGITPLEDGRARVEGDGFSVTARKVVLAAGAWSRPFAKMLGDEIPLETERGYHLEFACDMPLLNRPVSPIEFGFYLTPLTGRLRAAGTVELGGLIAPQSEKRLDYIEKRVRALFPQLGPVASTWLGFRPSLPDSLPVIGPSSKHPSVIYAFGHGHIGMTLGAITGRLVKEMIVGGKNSDEAAPFSPRRFRS